MSDRRPAGAALHGRFLAVWGIAPLVVVRFAGALATGGLAVYVARLHGAEYSGSLFYFISTVTILGVVTRLGVEPYLTAEMATGDRQEGLGRRLVASSVVSVALLVGVWLVLQGASVISQATVRRLVGETPTWLVVLATLGWNSVWIAGGYARAKGKAALSIFFETGLLYTGLLLLFAVASWLGITPGNTAIALGLFSLAPALALVMAIHLRGTPRGALTFASIRHAALGVSAFGAVTITNATVMLVPLQVLGLFGQTANAGVYNAALRVSMFVGAFGVIVKSAVVKSHARAGSTGTRTSRDVVDSALVAAPLLGASLVVVWQQDWVAALFGPEFTDMKPILLPMLVAQAIYSAGHLIEARAVMANERGILNLTSGTTIIVASAVTPLLVSRFDLSGAAWSFVIAVAVSRGQLTWLYLRRGSAPRPAAGSPEPSRVEKVREVS